MNTNINAGQHEVITITPLDADEQPGALHDDSIPSWAGPAVLVITPAMDGLSADVAVPVATTPGVYTVNVTGQAPSAATFTSSFTVTVQAQPATHFGFGFGPVA